MTVHYEIDNGIARLIAYNPPVNALGQDVRSGLLDGLRRAEADGAEAIVITGHGKTWFAGADIREFGKPLQEPFLPDVCAALENASIPVIAAIHGTALGGGLEVAMACHFRLATGTTKLGLPEVTLGLIPGAGGTQRLPRLVGFENAIDMITSGRPIDAQRALELGLVDHLIDETPAEAGARFAARLIANGTDPIRTGDRPLPDRFDFATARAAVKRKARGAIAPGAAIDAIEAGTRLGFEDGLAHERKLFLALMETDQRKALLHAFFAERKVSKLPELHGVKPRDVASVAVVGGGTMGSGIAASALLAGLPVTLVEMSNEAATAAKARITTILCDALSRNKINQAIHDDIFDRHFSVTTDFGALSSSDLIIEAVFEDMEVKRSLFRQLDTIAKPGAILATNTSYLDVNALAASTGRASDVIGLHFFSPAHIMKLLEIVVADTTAPEVTATCFALAKRLGKTGVRAGVCDGFIGNRILRVFRAAAEHMVLDGASPFDVDRALEDFGFAMGPFAVSDLAGLDIAWASRKRRAASRDPRERVPTYADALCEAGHFGRKTGKGYYVHKGTSRPRPNDAALALIEADRAARGITPRTFSADEIVERYLAAMVNEASRVLEDGIARRPLDVDVVLLTGYGFPRCHGGPMKWADLQGLPTVLETLEKLASEDAWFWNPAPLLRRLVAEGRRFDHLNQDTA